MLKPSIQTRVHEGRLVAEFWDCLRLDSAPVQELRAVYESHLKAGGQPNLVVDFSGVGFAGSMALGVLIRIQRLASQNGGRVICCNVDPNVEEVFRLSRVEQLFTFVADVPAALEYAVGSSAPRSEAAAPGGNGPPAFRPEPKPRPVSPLRRQRRQDS